MARDLMTIRLDSSARARLRAAARRGGLTSSAAVRLAIDGWLASEDARALARPYEQLADLLGAVESAAPPRRARARRAREGRGAGR